MGAASGKGEFDGLLKKAASSVLKHVKKHVKHKKWKSAYLDVRAPQRATSWISKLRVELENGDINKDLDDPVEGLLIAQLWRMKDELFPKQWYGLKLVVFPDGKYEVGYNYDPDCRNDPTFFDVDPG